MSALVTRCDVVLPADPRRVVARTFVPGHELKKDLGSRAPGVLSRVLDLPEDVVEATLARVLQSYGHRHRDFAGVLRADYEQMAYRIPEGTEPSQARRALVGAAFTQEYAIEGAALFNPSMVPHPDQSGLAPGEQRFVMSLRAVGEGHLSCVEFRTGVIGADGQPRVDEPGPHAETGVAGPTTYDRELFAAKMAEAGADAEAASFVLRRLPGRFDGEALEGALSDLQRWQNSTHGFARTGETARRIARCGYAVEFPAETTVAERVLWPQGPSESRGMEDARFVLFTAADGAASYRATYTAYDGEQISPQVMETSDFRRFSISQIAGPAARDKGMALFPREVDGRHLALTRSDKVTSGLSSSADGRWWDRPTTLHGPTQPWEIVQTGNCGSPVETSAGWVVLTHGVGPMREYAIGAILLDLEDPTRVLGALREPLLSPRGDEREGYVPNVVYSCGAMLHGERLVLPYGASDDSVRFAVVDLPLLLDRLTADGPAARTSAPAGPAEAAAPRATLANSSA